MSDSGAGQPKACVRCGHTRRAGTTTKLGQALRRTVGMKPVRVVCGEATNHGWPCPCRSRFHSG